MIQIVKENFALGSHEVVIMKAEQRLVKNFHTKMGFTINRVPTIINLKLNKNRLDLLKGEVKELEKGIMNVNIVEIADALGDLLYVVLGTAVAHGINMRDIFTEIHRSNMTKEPSSVTDGKAIKGMWYEPPNLMPILKEQSR